jgi:hypothetical protein
MNDTDRRAFQQLTCPHFWRPLNRSLKADGFDVPPPSRQHGSWTFYFDAPGGFTIEVLF